MTLSNAVRSLRGIGESEWRSIRFQARRKCTGFWQYRAILRGLDTITVVLRFPSVVAGDPVVVSASTYMSYRTCPEQAVARLRGHYPADTRASFRGGLAHRVFARHLAEGPIEVEALQSVCREEIGQALNPAMGRVGLKPSELKGLITEIGDLYARFKRFPTEGFRNAEVALSHEPAAGVTLKGTIDAVFADDGAVRLVDWKTGQLGNARHQLMFYASLWALERGRLPDQVEAVSVATGERLEAHPTSADATACLELVADLVSRAREAFASQTPLARVGGPWCRYCPVLEGCAEGTAAVALAG